jgi:DNA-binding LacI/PurR family transcriptional regulator
LAVLNGAGTTQATQHLLEQGYKRIAFLGGNKSIWDYHQRLSGFVQAMNGAGTPCSNSLCIQSDTNRDGGRRAMLEALKVEPNLQAVVVLVMLLLMAQWSKCKFWAKRPVRILRLSVLMVWRTLV